MPPGPGRPKGSINKADKNAREAIARFVDGNAENLSKWLDEVYKKDGAKEAFICFAKLIDYHVPKLSRQEISGNNGGPLDLAVFMQQVINTSAGLPEPDKEINNGTTEKD